MKAVILYNDPEVAREAKALFKRASERAAPAVEWTVELFREDMLASPQLAQEALHNSEDAHLSLLALGSQAELSPALLNWLEQWAQHRCVPDAALAVFEGTPGDTLSASASPALSEFADRHGLSLISGDVAPWEAEVPEFVWADPHEGEAAQSSITAGIRPQAPARSPCRHWGINE